MFNKDLSLEHQELAQRLWEHPFHMPGQQRDFTARLAMEQGWTRDFARQAIEEYRRFCFIACVANHPVTPSEQVDAVWHLHLLYTRDYWGHFCPNVLKRDFHHGPTLGGLAEENRFYHQYAATLASYQEFFGPPPEQFWPAAKIRFRPSIHSRWVYLPENWVIPKPRFLTELKFLRRKSHA